jgi:serine/threonine protein kinase
MNQARPMYLLRARKDERARPFDLARPYRDSFWNGANELCLVMIYCEGGDLAQAVQAAKGKIPEQVHLAAAGRCSCALATTRAARRLRVLQQLVEWFHQISLALAYLHSQKVLHRDLKPANVRPNPKQHRARRTAQASACAACGVRAPAAGSKHTDRWGAGVSELVLWGAASVCCMVVFIVFIGPGAGLGTAEDRFSFQATRRYSASPPRPSALTPSS